MLQVCSPVKDIKHRRSDQANNEIIDLDISGFPHENTQFEAVLIATPLARRRVGNISDGMVHAIGPQDIPYDRVKKSV